MERTPTSLKELAQLVIDVQGMSAHQIGKLAKREGLRLTDTTLNQMRAGSYKFTPREDTLRAMAKLARVDVEVAFHAAGLPVPGPPLADELPPGSDNLSPKSRAAVISLLRVLIDLESNHDEHPEHHDHPEAGERPTGAAGKDDGDEAPAGGRRVAGSGQKTDGRYPVPADFDLAAHPPMTMARDAQDAEFEQLGEENQDPEGEA